MIQESQEPSPQKRQRKQWYRMKFGKLAAAVLGWFAVAALLSLVPNSLVSRHPISISIFCVNLPFLVYHLIRYAAARKDRDLPRRASYAQLVKGNVLLAWWALCYEPIEALPNAGAKAGLVPVLLLAGLWYLCTAGRVRRRQEKKLEAQKLEVEQQSAGVWPPPPSQ